MSREEPKVSYVSSVSRLLLIRDPVAGEAVGPLLQQPVLMAVDNQVRSAATWIRTPGQKNHQQGKGQ